MIPLKKIITNTLKGTLLVFPFVMWTGTYNPFTLPKILIIWFLSILLCFFWFFSITKKNLEINKTLYFLFGLLFVFTIIIWISCLFSPDIWRALVGSGERAMGLAWYVFFIIIFSTLLLEKKTTYKLIEFLPIIGWILAIIGIIQVLWNFGNIDGRPFGTIWQYNIFWVFLLIPFFLSIEKIQSSSRKTWFSILLVLIFVAIILSWSRAAFLGLVWGGFLLFLLSSIQKKWKFFGIIASLSIISLLPFFQRYTLSEVNLASLYSRKEIIWYWLQAIQENSFGKNLFWGGPESQKFDLTKQYSNKILAYEKPGELPDRVHNPLLDIWLEFWFLWLLCFVGIFYITPIILWKNITEKKSLDTTIFVGILAIHIASFFGFYGPTVFILLAIAMSYLYQRQEISQSFFIPKFFSVGILLVWFLSSSLLTICILKESSDQQKLIENENIKLPVSIEEIQSYAREEFQARRAITALSNNSLDTESYNILQKNWSHSPYQLSRHILLLLAQQKQEGQTQLLSKIDAILKIFPKNMPILLLKWDILEKQRNSNEAKITRQILLDDLPDFMSRRAPENDYEQRKKDGIFKFIPSLSGKFTK